MSNFYGRKGQRNLNAKVRAHEAAVIRHLWRAERWTLTRLAREFQVSPATVHKIVHGQSWQDLDTTAELARLTYLASLVSARPIPLSVGENEGGAESDLSPLYVVESRKTHTTASQKVKNLHSIESRKKPTLRDVMVEIGLEKIEDLSDELLGTLKGQIDKQMVLVRAWEAAGCK